ncbi:MAG: STAS domain-containing protein [Desulfatibacillaceae bacterium]
MRLEEKREPNAWIVRPMERRLDAVRAKAFRNAMQKYVNNGVPNVILDFSTVEFLDSAGLGVLVCCRKRQGQNGSMAICNAHNTVEHLFKLLGLHRVFPLYGTETEALAALGPEGVRE